MRSPVERIRVALEGWLADEARERVWRWRGSPEAASAADVLERHAWLATGEARDSLTQAARMGLVSPPERAALAEHLARVAAERELAGARAILRAMGERRLEIDGRGVTLAAATRELLATTDARRRAALARACESSIEALLPELLDARAGADEAASQTASSLGPAAGDEDPRSAATAFVRGPASASEADANALSDLARELLRRTEDAAREASESVVRRVGRAGDAAWADLASGLRCPELDPIVPRRGRWRRIGAGIAALGFDQELASRVRAEENHGTLSPRARVVAPSIPADVRVAEAPIELGLASELEASVALGRALALALTSPALPIELRHPPCGPATDGVGRALGSLFAQLVADPTYLRRVRDLDGASRERASRHAARLLLLGARLDAAAYLVSVEARTPRDRVDATCEHLRDALHVLVPPPVAALVGALPSGAAPRLRGRLAGLAAAIGMRDRWDEDWFRNPRASETLRAGAAPGCALRARQWLDETVAVPRAAGIDRLIELVG